MKALSTTNSLRSLVLIALFCVCALSFLESCSSDEPDMTNEYYMVIDAKDEIFRRGGLPPEPKLDMIGLITERMMDTISRITLSHDGDLIIHDAAVQRSRDGEVIAACDDLYKSYIETGFKDVTICTAYLYRAKKLNGIVKKSQKLKAYRF